MPFSHRLKSLAPMAIGLVTVCAACGLGGAAVPTVAHPSFTTLGTNSGPIPNPHRAEPANLLRSGNHNILIDAGDGAAWQLSKVGVPLGDVETVIISHLHFDHTGGLFAFLSQRYQSISTGTVTIYGPPGTQKLVESLVAGMDASTQGPMYARAKLQGKPGDAIKVVEIGNGAKFEIGEVKVTAASNTHFSVPADSPDAAKFVSLSFRFDLPGRSIVYPGDTGPSGNVEALAKGVDMLFCEIMDSEAALAKLKRDRPGVPDMIWTMVANHFRTEHMSPNEVGLLASRVGARALVLTHDAIDPADIPKARAGIAAHYKGKITFAEDLNAF